MDTAEKRLQKLGLSPQTIELKGMVKIRQSGNLVYLSGHGCELPKGGLLYSGS